MEKTKSDTIKDYQMFYQRYDDTNLLLHIPPELVNGFWQWFGTNSIIFNPDTDVVWQDLPKHNHEYTYGACHMNSFINYCNHDYELYCGLVIQTFSSIKAHSFNVDDSGVIDFTYFHNQEKFGKIFQFPFNYIAIKIPDDFLLIIKEKLHTMKLEKRKCATNFPLLSVYYLYTEHKKDIIGDVMEEMC